MSTSDRVALADDVALLSDVLREVCANPARFRDGRAFLEHNFAVETLQRPLLDELDGIVKHRPNELPQIAFAHLRSLALAENPSIRIGRMHEWARGLGLALKR